MLATDLDTAAVVRLTKASSSEVGRVGADVAVAGLTDRAHFEYFSNIISCASPHVFTRISLQLNLLLLSCDGSLRRKHEFCSLFFLLQTIFV